MIYYAAAIGLGWIVLSAIATLTMLATVAWKEGASGFHTAFWNELPRIIGVATPGVILVLIAVVSLVLVRRRTRPEE